MRLAERSANISLAQQQLETPGSNMVQIWFKHVSNVVQTPFSPGSSPSQLQPFQEGDCFLAVIPWEMWPF